MADIYTPGSVRAADEAFDGLPVQVPPFDSTPATTGPNNVDGGGSSVDGPIADSLALSGTPSDPNQTIQITPPQVHQLSINGGTASPQSPNTTNVTQNNVAGQVYGVGTPQNVYI